MNERAATQFAQAEARMQAAAVQLRQLLNEQEAEAFERAQDAWLAYRNQQVEFVAAEYEGGSIVPLIESSERQMLTEARAVTLEAAFKERAERIGINTMAEETHGHTP